MLLENTYAIVHKDTLPFDGNTFEFEGLLHEDAGVSFIWVDMTPGSGIRLHRHPYQEIFIIQEGTATFTVGSSIVIAHGGEIIIVPAETPHRFINTGECLLRQVDIHVSREIITEWLE